MSGHPCDKYEETFHSFEWNRNTLWWRNVRTGHRVSPKWSVHTSANLIFHFSNKNGKRKYYLSLSYLHISKYRKKEKKRKWSGKSIIFFISLVYGKLGDRYAIFRSFNFLSKMKKWRNGPNKYNFFIFLVNMELWKLGARYAIFLFFHFLNKMEKMKKWYE